MRAGGTVDHAPHASGDGDERGSHDDGAGPDGGAVRGHDAGADRQPPARRRGPARDRRLLARRELPDGRPDLPARQSAAARAAAARARETSAARPLGHEPGPQLRVCAPQPHHPRARHEHAVRHRPRPRRTGGRRQHLPRGHLQRDLSERLHRRRRPEAPLHAVLLPGGHPEPRGTRDARFHPRRRRARLLARARLRRGLRQPRPGGGVRDRRRGGGDRPACDGVALEQVPQPEARRRGAADPPPQRLQDREPHDSRPHQPRRARATARRLRLAPVVRRGRRAGSGARADGGDARRRLRRDPRDPGAGARVGAAAAAALADGRARHAEGLDGPEGGRRPAGRGLMALAPGADPGGAHEPRSPAAARIVDASLPPRGAVRRARHAACGARGARAARRPPHGREPAHERRSRAPRAASARLPRLRRRRHARPDDRRGDARARCVPARRDAPERRRPQLPRVRPRRDGVEPPRRGARGDRARLDGGDRADGRPPRAGRPRHGDAQRAHAAGLARGLPAHRPARLLLVLRGVHPHRRLDVQPAREVAEGDEGDPLAAADRVAQLPADVARLAPGPQRLQPPGPGVHRPRHEQEGRDRPRLPAARREHAAVGRRSLPAQPALRQRDRRRQAAADAVPRHGRGGAPLRRRASASGTGRPTTTARSPTS